MKKIPTLFNRTYDGPRIKGITDEVTPGLEWVLAGDGLATVKIDGTCCAVIVSGVRHHYLCLTTYA